MASFSLLMSLESSLSTRSQKAATCICWQDLAERGSRSEGHLVIVGILHQSFEQYAGKLNRTARDEWAKVQGRFQNVPFVAQADEVAALLARAVTSDRTPTAAEALARKTAEAVAARRPVDAESLAEALRQAWPLHPVTSLLLGPVSRQRFAQNERSVFGFLSSAEPHGFQAHLAATNALDPDAWFGPDQLWDYLVANFGSALSVGPDGARMTLAMEAVERAALRGQLCAKLAKAAALIEFFRNGSGLAVADDFLRLSRAAQPSCLRYHGCLPRLACSSASPALAPSIVPWSFLSQKRSLTVLAGVLGPSWAVHGLGASQRESKCELIS